MLKHDLRQFNPDEFARLDADMWVAYYNHNFFRLFVLLLKLNYSHFRPNLLLTMRGAYHSAMAAIVFRKTKGHEDNAKILKHLTQFYKLLSNHNIQPFDYKKAAELELEWWYVDRYPKRYKISRATALADGMAAIYNVAPSKLKTYGEKRAEAMELLGDYHHDVSATVDWQKLRRLLEESYRAMYEVVGAIEPKLSASVVSQYIQPTVQDFDLNDPGHK